jgi:hypothetical protein
MLLMFSIYHLGIGFPIVLAAACCRRKMGDDDEAGRISFTHTSGLSSFSRQLQLIVHVSEIAISRNKMTAQTGKRWFN